MLRALAPERLTTAWGPTDVTNYVAFRDRYCVWRPMKPGRNPYARPVPVIMGGKNEHELKARMEGFGLRRTQAEVGIGEPIYEILPLLITEAQRRKVDRDIDARAVMAAVDAGATKALEMHLGPLRRLTGEIKARAVVEAVREEFESGLDKIVLMAWHTEVIRILTEGLSQFGVVGLDGSTSADNRQRAVDRFRSDPAIRVFVGQIVAAGEAIDISAAATLWFVESSFQPAQMKQASLRVTNFGQTRQVVVRVCALEGSIDDALQTTLLRKWASIREVLE
jgi:tellurite resistance protein